jgi:ArsR family transcriptional regulator
VTKRLTLVREPTSAPSCCGTLPKLRPKDTRPFAPLFKALGDETRLEILGMLASAGDALCVCQIENQVKHLSQPTISHHLQKLRDAELVTAERRGTWVYYALNRATLAQLKQFAGLVGA